ncbi:MAG: dihydropteroate synthase [Rikenellaceae bacterium]|nr:dihydropteroate synthase [Rikenellaceae bacterium]
MSIVNVTPDSFYSGCRSLDSTEVEQRIREVVSQGCDIIDIGGYSSRPGADEVSIEEELRRVAMGVNAARRLAPQIPVSIDTFRAEVVRSIVQEFGDVIVNDISAGELSHNMIETVAELQLPYVAMHMRGTPTTMQSKTEYTDITSEVVNYLSERAKVLTSAGVQNIVLDPGFGFAKSLQQNYELLHGLTQLSTLGYPVLVGISRKSMIYKALNTTQEDALIGTVALHWECLRAGAKILRVHDTREAVQTIKLFEIYEANRQSKQNM